MVERHTLDIADGMTQLQKSMKHKQMHTKRPIQFRCLEPHLIFLQCSFAIPLFCKRGPLFTEMGSNKNTCICVAHLALLTFLGLHIWRAACWVAQSLLRLGLCPGSDCARACIGETGPRSGR